MFLLENTIKKYYEGIRLNLQNELGLWVSKDHFLADKNVIEATNLKDISLVVAHQAINDGEVPSFISDDQIIGTYDLIENARVIVKHNLASALVINKEDYDPDLKFIHIKNMPQYHWYMIWKKESKTKIQEKFIDYLRAMKTICNTDIVFVLNLKQYFGIEDLREIYKHCFYTKTCLVNLEGIKTNPIEGDRYIIVNKDLCVLDLSY